MCKVNGKCVQSVGKVCAMCEQSVCRVCAKCEQSVCKMCAKCFKSYLNLLKAKETRYFCYCYFILTTKLSPLSRAG